MGEVKNDAKRVEEALKDVKGKLKGFKDTNVYVNKNDYIDWNDFEMLIQKIGDLRGENSKEYRIARDAMMMVWKGLLQETKGIDISEDLHGEEVVTIVDWINGWSKFNPKKLPIWQWEYLKYMFFFMDVKGDKKIDIEEYCTAMSLYGIPEVMSKDAFMKMCIVGEDGLRLKGINYGRFVQLWNEYFTAGDKFLPGNYLFGTW